MKAEDVFTLCDAITERLTATREARGLTTQQLAANASLTPAYVYKLEREGVGNIGLATLGQLCDALRVDLHDMLIEDYTLPHDMTKWRSCPHCRKPITLGE